MTTTRSWLLGTLALAAGSLLPAPVAGQQEAPAANVGDTVVVTMANTLAYDPPELTIRAGQTVVWRNGGQIIHTVTADPELAQKAGSVRLPEGAEAFHSGDLGPGAVYARTFTVPGRYTYFCLPHELAGMVGHLVVEEMSGRAP